MLTGFRNDRNVTYIVNETFALTNDAAGVYVMASHKYGDHFYEFL